MKQPAAPNSIPARRKAVFYALLYGGFLLCLLAAEVVFRFLAPEVPSIRYFVSGPTHADDKPGAATYEGDPLLGWRLRAGLREHWWDFTTFSTNARHLRHPREVGRKKAGAFRIVALGDSVTFGYRVPVSWPEEPMDYDRTALPYPRIMENLLRKQYPNREVEAISLAVPGYSSHQGLAWLRRDIERYDPDVVIAAFGWNDTDARALEDKITLPVAWHRVLLRSLIARSQIAIHLAHRVGTLKRSPAGAVSGQRGPRVSKGDYVANLTAIARLARAHGAGVVVLGQVYRDAVKDPAQARLITANRRVLAETCRRVRARIGEDPLLGCRISIFNKLHEGFGAEDLRTLVAGLEETGLDLLHLSTLNALGGYLDTAKTLGQWVKEMTDLPTIVAGRLREPADAERVIAEGHADFAAVGKAMITDPEWTRGARKAVMG